jgi:hypothetical protein
MPSFLRGMFQGRRPTTTTRGSTEVPYPLLAAAPPCSLGGSVLHWRREFARETQAALRVDEIQRTDAAEAGAVGRGHGHDRQGGRQDRIVVSGR